ncbi:MAG: chemotaxis protein CheW [Fimbriiglobus sp.]
MVATLKNTETIRLVRVGLSGEEFAVPLDAVETILRLEPGRWADNGEYGNAVRGSLVYRGEEVGVLCLGSLLGRNPVTNRHPFAILLNSASGRFAILVDRVSQSKDYPLDQLQTPPELVSHSTNGLVSHFIAEEETFLMVMAAERLIDDTPAKSRRRNITTREKPSGLAEQIIAFRSQEFTTSERPYTFGIPARNVVEVMTLPPIQKLPTTSSDFLGVVPWRGRVLPVVDLSARMGLAPSSAAATRAVVTLVDGRPFALAAMPGVHVWNLPLPHAASTKTWPSQYLRGAVELKAESLLSPDLVRLLGD